MFFVGADDEDVVVSSDGADNFGPVFVVDAGGDGLSASGGRNEDEEVHGLADFEAVEGGAVWRFRNEGNRDSFAAHPEIYGPQFGGYDPVDVARGVTVAGNPLFWLIIADRLYLFRREEARDAFAANPATYLKDAKLRWPALEQQLAQ